MNLAVLVIVVGVFFPLAAIGRPILLRETVISTEAEPSLLDAEVAGFFEQDQPCLLLVQFDEPTPTHQALQEHLSPLGASVLYYVPESTWLISGRASPQLLAALRAHPQVRWASPLQAEHKHPSLPQLFPALYSAPPTTTPTSVELRMLLVAGLQRSYVAAELVADWKRLFNGDACRFAGASHRYASAVCVDEHSARRVVTLLRSSPLVMWIERRQPRVTFNAFAEGVTQSGEAGSTPIWQLGITGSGQLIAFGDSGIDYNRCYFASPEGLPFDTFTDEPTVIAFNNGTQLAGYWAYIDRYEDPSGHGTHVAGSIAGNAAGNAGAQVLTPYNGMAPDARLLMTDIGCQTPGGCPCNPNLSCPARCTGGVCAQDPRETYEPDDLATDFFPFSYMNGARIHTNSWGEPPSDGSYGTSSLQIDQFAYEHPDMLILFAAGNDGATGLYSIGPEGTAKNSLTVGAAQTTNAGWQTSVQFTNFTPTVLAIQKTLCDAGYPDCLAFNSTDACCSSADACGFLNNTDPQCFAAQCCPATIAAGFANTTLYSQNNMASFSSRGWTQDGRIKPDVVAPGQRIISSNSQGTVNGAAVPCGAVPVTSELVQKSGTSMATPVTAGNAALVRQFYMQTTFGDDEPLEPVASLIKATLINSGVGLDGLLDLTGRGNKYLPLPGLPNNYPDVTPSPYQGFGRIQLDATLQAPFFFATNAQLQERNIKKGKTGHKICLRNTGNLTDDWIKVTLVWTDPPPFPGAAKALVNDLDLRVVHNFDEYLGNQRFNARGQPVRDDVNNVEQIYLKLHQNGYFSVLVTVVPPLTTANQSFSVVITGSEGIARWNNPTDCLDIPLVPSKSEFFTIGNTIGISVGASLIFFFFVVVLLLFMLRSRNIWMMSTVNDITQVPYQSI